MIARKVFEGKEAGRLVKIDRNGSKHYEGRIVCDRCSGYGIFFTRVENGHGVPAEPDGGVCWKCGGLGFVSGKWIERTPEYQSKLDAKREARQAAARAKWEAEHAEEIARRKAEAERKEAERKAREEAERIAREAEEARKAATTYYGNVGDKVEVEAVFAKRRWFDFRDMFGRENRMYVLTFTAGNNTFVWKTGSTSLPEVEEGATVTLKGTIKEHNEYKGEKQTVLIRCKIS